VPDNGAESYDRVPPYAPPNSGANPASV
jgi:hypothetical protein